MQVLGIDRVLVATADIDDSVARFEELLDLSFGSLIDPPGEPAANRMSASGIEFVTTDDEDSAVGRFLAERGPGLYALALEVTDLDAARERLAEKGVEPIGEMDVADFRELFYHPSSFEGALLVLTEYDHRHPAEIAARGLGGDDD
ncbi:VOC family protein [Haloarchaeobius sp. HRN-SO-5]|uniref:VOC family protein n=1 Tax=Haloarchaeobius sp. HRN-SO-5 TaxID=3446118 RepID=UPI003EBE8858